MGIALARIDAGWVSLAFGAWMLAGWLAGLWIGRRPRISERKSRSFKSHEANLALLGLLIAFTFSISLGEQARQKAMVVSDSNAIGDLYTCAGLLKEPVRARLQSVIRQYTELDIGLAGRWRDKADLERTLSQMQQLQGKMTEFVAEAVNGGTLIAVPLTNALNEVTGMNATRIATIEDRLHPAIVILLFMAAFFTMFLVGREQGFEGKMEFAGPLGLIVLITMVVYVILDLNQPARGFITVSQEPLQRLLSSMGK